MHQWQDGNLLVYPSTNLNGNSWPFPNVFRLNGFNSYSETSQFVGVLMLKEMYPLFHSLFLNSVSLWKRAFLGQVVTVVENAWINAACKGSIQIYLVSWLVSLQVVSLPTTWTSWMVWELLCWIQSSTWCFFLCCTHRTLTRLYRIIVNRLYFVFLAWHSWYPLCGLKARNDV